MWQRLNSLWAKIRQGHVQFKVVDLVRITKGKVKFGKGYEQTFTTEIFRVVEVIQRVPNLFTNWQTCKIVLSKASFTITNFIGIFSN